MSILIEIKPQNGIDAKVVGSAAASVSNVPAVNEYKKNGRSADNVGGDNKPTEMQMLHKFLTDRYLFRYNQLTEQTECAGILKDDNGKVVGYTSFRPADTRLLNGISIAAMDEGLKCWDRDVKRFVESDLVTEYHPFKLYFDSLPEWDGVDRVTPLAKRVSSDKTWVICFHRWMLGLTAQWLGYNKENRANSLAPILVSTAQGWGKSTFCRMLMPKSLSRFYTDSFDLNTPSAAEQKLAAFGLINLDEFDKLPPGKLPLLKNIMQMASLNIRKAYKRSCEPLMRIASFIGTSNRRDLLVDKSGSRRFICVELRHPIDCVTPVDHDKLYAQLKHEILHGRRYWLSKREEAATSEINKAFYRTVPEEEVFNECFRFADADDPSARIMSSAEIFAIMKKHNPAAMRGSTCNSFSRLLPALGERVHTRCRNGYRVKMKDFSGV